MKDLRQIVDVYGADPARWPEEDRLTARAFVLQSKEAQAMLRDAEVVDDLLASLTAPPPSDKLVTRVSALGPDAAALRPDPSSRLRAILRAALLPLAAGAAGAAVVAASLWLVFAGAIEPEVVAPPAGFDIVSEDTDPGLLQDVAVVDIAAADPTAEFSDADLGLDTSIAPVGDGLTQVSSGSLAAMPLD